MPKKASFILFAFLAVVVGLYPAIYFLIDRRFGLLGFKSKLLLANVFWNIGFYTHIVFGGLALLIGWTQFSPKFRNKNLGLHRKIGKVYVIAVLLSATAGIGIAFSATGGFISSLGFLCLGIIWFATTLMAYVYIKNKQLIPHKKMMIYSYAACFAAVTLRIWLPLLAISLKNFVTAYTIVAWLSWVPNLLVAGVLVRRLKPVEVY